MAKLSTSLYKATRKMGKIASTVNTIESIGKSVETGDMSHLTNRIIRKETNKIAHKTANKASSNINKLLK